VVTSRSKGIHLEVVVVTSRSQAVLPPVPYPESSVCKRSTSTHLPDERRAEGIQLDK
jgi:hypothetical protein